MYTVLPHEGIQETREGVPIRMGWCGACQHGAEVHWLLVRGMWSIQSMVGRRTISARRKMLRAFIPVRPMQCTVYSLLHCFTVL